jgi:hypothetical protein
MNNTRLMSDQAEAAPRLSNNAIIAWTQGSPDIAEQNERIALLRGAITARASRLRAQSFDGIEAADARIAELIDEQKRLKALHTRNAHGLEEVCAQNDTLPGIVQARRVSRVPLAPFSIWTDNRQLGRMDIEEAQRRLVVRTTPGAGRKGLMEMIDHAIDRGEFAIGAIVYTPHRVPGHTTENQGGLTFDGTSIGDYEQVTDHGNFGAAGVRALQSLVVAHTTTVNESHNPKYFVPNPLASDPSATPNP